MSNDCGGMDDDRVRTRDHGRILSVETKVRGDALLEDAPAGATVLVVADAGDFDEDGGWLTINDQVVQYVDVDDDEGVITLANALTAAAEVGDQVALWSTLYREIVDYQEAEVVLDGEHDNPEAIVAEVSTGIGELPEGDRGEAGESCVLLRVSADEWEIVGVGGRPQRSQGVKFYQDSLTVTVAGDQFVPLTYEPIDNSEHVYWNGIYQPQTEWTRTGRAIGVADPDGLLEAGDRIDVEYAYTKDIATALATPDPAVPTVDGSKSNVYLVPLTYLDFVSTGINTNGFADSGPDRIGAANFFQGPSFAGSVSYASAVTPGLPDWVPGIRYFVVGTWPEPHDIAHVRTDDTLDASAQSGHPNMQVWRGDLFLNNSQGMDNGAPSGSVVNVGVSGQAVELFFTGAGDPVNVIFNLRTTQFRALAGAWAIPSTTLKADYAVWDPIQLTHIAVVYPQ